jgi:hypothetical protein
MARFLASLAAATAFAGTAASAGDLAVTIDQTKVLQLRDQAATIVVGNPAIADVTMQDGDTAFVVGKSFGSTNIIALDAGGQQIANIRVTVASAKERTVTLLRGKNQETFSCTPRCERTPMPGDAPDVFSSIVDQAAKKAGMAASASGGGAN